MLFQCDCNGQTSDRDQAIILDSLTDSDSEIPELV